MIVLVILHGDVVGFPHFQPFKQFVKGRGVFVAVLPHIRRTQHFHDHRKILLVGRRFVFQIENKSQQEHRCGRVPKRIVGLAAFRRGAFEQVGHKPLHIVVVPQVDKRVVAVAFLHIQQIQHTHLIALLPQQVSRAAQQFAFRVQHGKARVGLAQIRFGVKSCFACAAAADHDRVEIAAVLSSVQSHPDILREDLVVLRYSRPVFSVDGSGRAPLGRTVFLASTVIAAGR